MAVLSGVSAAFIGSGKLLVECAGQWVQQGGAIHGVVSDCPVVSAWCAQKGIDRLAPALDVDLRLLRVKGQRCTDQSERTGCLPYDTCTPAP